VQRHCRAVHRPRLSVSVGHQLGMPVEVELQLRGIHQSDWIDRYGNRFEDARLPKSAAEREALAEQVGADGLVLLEAILGQMVPIS
jgi:hypothetical protein